MTRKVDDLVAALGAESGISKSEVSRICAELDTDVSTFNTRDLGEQQFPYVFLDARYCKARVGGDKTGKGARVVPGRGHRHRWVRRRAPEGPRLRGRRLRDSGLLDAVPTALARPGRAGPNW